ncbi:Alpha/Beta hydrolase protein [Cantharellus anzutake]|uniref:Alpha/Beta hydrolase protein n=1 Tax=Cantharellus anzutake TaxID=1750568 RepID=UPI001905B7F0|nr:Alpha/Beta hydrolase protein [Cantharellus anzutake]KAF8342987.1 Alpha/Beta hydrolase protein [Cantharellus anzutake]
MAESGMSGVLVALLVLSASILIPTSWPPTPSPSVKLFQGTVVGKVTVAEGTGVELEQFLGIPFALPPTGDLRFRAPQKILDDESRVIKATEYGYACLQPPWPGRYHVSDPKAMSEDCLNLNVIRPKSHLGELSLPVMVWIHGGAFVLGGSSVYNGSELVAQSVKLGRPIIYVSINYRLNLFGFLASPLIEESDDAHLNAGLHDQRLALWWIQRNIGAFGGDPSKVTVFGESAGAMSIAAHLLWNHGRGAEQLFGGAILQSGAASGFPVPEPLDHAQAFQDFNGRLDCNSSSTEKAVLSCLRKVPSEILYRDMVDTMLMDRIEQLAAASLHRPFAFVQDARKGMDGFIYDLPSVIIQNGHIAKVPIIIGANLDEGTMFAPRDLKDEKTLEEYIRVGWIFPAESNKGARLTRKLLSKYPDDPSLGKTNQYKRFSSIIGDYLLDSGRRMQALATSKLGVPVWNYLFEHCPIEPPNPHWGVHHSAEIPYGESSPSIVLPLCLSSPPAFGVHATRKDEHGDVSRYLLAAWINFAYDLDPNGRLASDGAPGSLVWPKYTVDKRLTLNIRTPLKTKVVNDDYRGDAIQWVGSDLEFNRATRR